MSEENTLAVVAMDRMVTESRERSDSPGSSGGRPLRLGGLLPGAKGWSIIGAIVGISEL